LIFIFTNKIFNYISFSVSELLLSIILIAIGVFLIFSSVTFEGKFHSISPGISEETRDIKINGVNIFLGLLSIGLGIGHLAIKSEEKFLSIIGIVLGLFFIFISPKRKSN